MSALDLWVLGIFQGDTGQAALGAFYAVETDFWWLIGRLAEREAPEYFAAAWAKTGL